MSDKIPENSAQNSPPESLQETTFACGHDGCDAEFETSEELANHTMNCDKGED